MIQADLAKNLSFFRRACFCQFLIEEIPLAGNGLKYWSNSRHLRRQHRILRHKAVEGNTDIAEIGFQLFDVCLLYTSRSTPL